MKDGVKTTEFWALLALGALVLANGSSAIDIPWEQVQWYGGIVAAYIAGRSWVKSSEAKAKDPAK